jgi:repressor LexA
MTNKAESVAGALIRKTNPPTHKQLAVLAFIERKRRETGISPSFAEIQAHFGYASVNSVQNHLRFLRSKGLIAWQKSGAGSKKRTLMSLRPETSAVPLIGHIAAGTPIEAIENVEKSINLSDLGIDNTDGNYFALRVEGDSMINAHILDNDIVVIKRQPDVDPDDIAAVRWNNRATLKYVSRKGTNVILKPANDLMQPITVTEDLADSFLVLGKAVRVIREKLTK